MNTADMSPAVRAAFLHHDWTAASAREFTAQLERLCTELDADLPTYLWVVFGAFFRGGYPSSETVGQIFAEFDDDPREA